MTVKQRYCELCGAEIPKEWDNEIHYGTCPSCKRGANFVLKNITEILDKEEIIKWQNDEKEKRRKSTLLESYGVIDTNKRSGMQHVNCINLAKLIIKECGMHFKTVEDMDTGKQEIYYYNSGFYHCGGENRIKTEVDYFLDDLTSIHRKSEVADYIKNKNIINRSQLEPPLRYINLQNGIYDLTKDELLEHDPKYFFINQIPIDYDKNATCPKIISFFHDVLYKEYYPLMQELFGFLLYREYFLHKAFMFYGGGRNGKGTTIRLISKLLGEKNYSSRKLISLMEDRFAKASLFGKMANLGAEVSGKVLNDTSDFKNLTGGEPITGERKFFGSFNFTNYAKLIFNANQIPYSKDKSTAFFARWIIIVFPETFEMDDKKTNPNIFNEISTDEEMSGLLNWALDGLRRLKKTNRFSYAENGEEDEGERYELLAKPDMRFIYNTLTVASGEFIPTEDVYAAYEEWAEPRRYPILTKTAFSRSIKRYMRDKEKKIFCEVTQKKIGGKNTRCYLDITWKEQPKKQVNNIESFSLSDDLRGMRDKITENASSGYRIDDKWLYDNFKASLVDGAIRSGLLIKRPDGQYGFN